MKKFIYKLLFIVSITCIILGNIETKTVSAAPNDVVNIPDANLKAVLNTTLGNAADVDITEAQMASITTLTLNNANIANLTGLEYATGVEYMYMYGNQVTNLEPIKSMSGLTSLSLSGNNITSSNFPNLSQLPALTRLDLGGAAVDNAVLQKVNKILTLNMVRFQSNYNITTIEPLTSLPNLKELWVQFCGINDFRPINNMPLLTDMLGAGQNTGRLDPHTILNRSSLDYDEVAQTLHIPFSMMPNVKTNFDGTKSPFTTSTSSSMTYVGFNDVAVSSTRLAIDSNGITVSDVTLSEFQGLNELEYNAYYDLPAGSYATPPNFNFYSISGGTYDHFFDIVDRPTISAKDEVTYYQYSDINEQLFYKDIDLKTEANNQIISDFLDKVNFKVVGTYYVTITANNGGVSSNPISVTVHIIPRNNTHKLSFNLNGGSGKTPSVQNLKSGSLASKPANPQREGFTFKGWNTAQKGNGLNWDFDKEKMPNKDVILYAQWSKEELPKTGYDFSLLIIANTLVGLGMIRYIIKLRNREGN